MFHGQQFIFFDEAGEMNFSPRASKHVSVVAMKVVTGSDTLMEKYWSLKHSLFIAPPDDAEIRRRFQNKRFHASEDPQPVRDMVFDLITNNIGQMQVRAVVIDKDNVDTKHRNEEWLYENLYFYLFRSILDRSGWTSAGDKVRLLIDLTEDKRMREATIRGVRSAETLAAAPFISAVHHVSSFHHPFLQLADYFCWAIYRKYEKKDLRSYKLIKEAVRDEWRLYKK